MAPSATPFSSISSNGAPTAKSFTPSPSRSPIFAMEVPSLSLFDSVGPFVVNSLISTVESTEPSVFINMMCTAPRFLPSSSSWAAPTAKSFTPSPSKSPMFAIEAPNLSLADSVGPFSVESLITTVDFTEPSVSINMM